MYTFKSKLKIAKETVSVFGKQYVNACPLAGEVSRPTFIRDLNVVAEEFNNYFASVGSNSSKLAEEIAQNLTCHVQPYLWHLVDIEGDNMFQLSPVTSDDVSDIITTMHSNKAPGNDTIHTNVLKDCLSSIVYPRTSLINSSFAAGSFPRQWKQSEIIPIPKYDDYEEAVNNRPICLLPVVSKICERVVHNQFINYLPENERLPVNQSGKRKQHSTETLGLSATVSILDAMDKKQVTAMV